MKRILFMHVFLLCMPRVHAMENGQQVLKRIKLQSSDNLTFDISEKEAHLFGTLKDMLIDIQKDENPGDESPVPVSMSGDDLQAMVEDIPWIRRMHAAQNQNIDDIDNIVQLDGKTRRERARQSVKNIDQIPMYSDEILQVMLKRIKATSFLKALESVEKNAKIISKLLLSQNFLSKLHADPNNNAVQSVFSLPEGLQGAIHFYMPQHWGEHVRIRHDDGVESVAFSPNGQLLATGSDDGKARIIEVATGVVKRRIKHDNRVNSVAFSPNGEWLAAGSSDGNARIIEVATGIVRHTIKHGDTVYSVAFSPNGELLATGSGDSNARIIEVATGIVRHTIKHAIKHSNWVHSVAFSPNGELLATGPSDGNARIIEVATGVVKHAIKHDYSGLSVAFSPDGEWLATGKGYNVRIIEVATGVVKHAIEHSNSVRSVAFSPNSELLAVGSWAVGLWSNNAQIIEIATGAVTHAIKHGDTGDTVASVAFSPNGELLATGSSDAKARIHAYLTDNFKNAVLASYLKWCQEDEIQSNKQGWISEAIQNHRYQKALRDVFPGLI